MKIVDKLFWSFMGAVLSFLIMKKVLILICKNKDKRIKMFSSYFYTLDKWMKLKRNNYNVDDFLVSHGYLNIAIYGIGIMGQQFLAEIRDGKTRVVYAIDQGCDNPNFDFPVKTLEDDLEKVDIIIVTPDYDFEKIEEQLKNKVFCPIIPINYLIEECYYESKGL